ncbi:uncharacterized protein LOC103569641 isoform X1 [Microplitis demolitor]|uniref:uncharacterized protein LOC103569641 isoform X1 n=1 Tax=Microplitis demolitor TaxID=69319 RepID=UPI00235B5EAB|nr:uncharacterized protein LOC103569641 isoform X1 [Microplitis demolitor]
MDIYDLKSIKKFVDLIETKTVDYQLTNSTLSEDDKNMILKVILIDMTDLLEKLNKIADDKQNFYESGGLKYFIKMLQEYKIKNDYSRSDFMESYLTTIDEKREQIEAYVGSLLFFRNGNYFDDVIKFCPFVPKITRTLNVLEYGEFYEKVYQKLMAAILSDMKEVDESNFCGQSYSFQQEIFNFYHLAMTPYLKKFIMFYFLHIIKDRCEDKISIDAIREKSILLDGFSENIRITKKVLQDVTHYMYRCDLKSKVKSSKESYYELEKMIQAIIIEEKDLSTTQSCSENCNLHTAINHIECKELYECRYIASSLEICEKGYGGHSRRYDWFKDSNGVIYGDNNNEKCHQEIKSVYSYYNPLELTYCDYCVCSCLKKSIREYMAVTAISFRDQLSDITNNMVIVGVRFIKKSYMIHVQIKEGKLKSRGSVNELSWRELEKFDYNDETEKYYVQQINESWSPLILGVDYGHPRTINFDDLFAPEDYVVTGVRFRFAMDSLDSPELKESPIELQIRVTPFDYLEGKIINHNQTHWISSNYRTFRDELILENPDKPTKSPGNEPDSNTNQFISFQASDLKKDAGQSTVPFFDSLEAEGYPEFPLGGVGIMHRGREGFGGFLTFRIFDLNISKYFNDKY